jgi:SAM-dependent methyltransferase
MQFDAEYYRKGCGPIPYGEGDAWAMQVENVAANVMARFAPGSVLDAGCAYGLYVQALRGFGVDALGMDVSDYAIARAPAGARAYCHVASLATPWTAPLDRQYDLVMCIEVLEHMPEDEGMRAIANLCAHTDAVLFSSSPDDFTEPTHVNVRPREYWQAAFGRHGFQIDNAIDAGFVAPWAMGLRRKGTRSASTRRKVLVLADEFSSRARAVAQTLVPAHVTTLGCADAGNALPGVRMVADASETRLAPIALHSDVVVLSGSHMLPATHARIFIDAPPPLTAEMKGQHAINLRTALGRAECVLCENELQRARVLGMLEALGRITPAWLKLDPDLTLIAPIAPDAAAAAQLLRDRIARPGEVPPPMSGPVTGDDAVRILEQDRDKWRNLARAYERGRLMRFMRWLKRRRAG